MKNKKKMLKLIFPNMYFTNICLKDPYYTILMYQDYPTLPCLTVWLELFSQTFKMEESKQNDIEKRLKYSLKISREVVD